MEKAGKSEGAPRNSLKCLTFNPVHSPLLLSSNVIHVLLYLQMIFVVSECYRTFLTKNSKLELFPGDQGSAGAQGFELATLILWL